MRTFFIHVPIWERKVLIVVKGSKRQILHALKRRKMGRFLRSEVCRFPPHADDAATVYYDESRGRYLMAFNKWDGGTVDHEVNHVVRNMMKFLGARSEDEANAYTFEWLNREVKKRLRTVS